MKFRLEHRYGEGWYVMVPHRHRDRMSVVWLRANMFAVSSKSKAREYAIHRGYTEEVKV